MPPQQTNAGSATESDAAVRGLTIGVLKAAHGALPEKYAAGPPAVPTRDVLSLLKQYWRAFGQWQCRRSQTSLHDLSDRELMDIGVTREEIDHITPQRAIDALRDSIHSRGVM